MNASNPAYELKEVSNESTGTGCTPISQPCWTVAAADGTLVEESHMNCPMAVLRYPAVRRSHCGNSVEVPMASSRCLNEAHSLGPLACVLSGGLLQGPTGRLRR